MQCKKHRTYKAIRMPQCDCLECWKQYAMTQKNNGIELEAQLKTAKRESQTPIVINK